MAFCDCCETAVAEVIQVNDSDICRKCALDLGVDFDDYDPYEDLPSYMCPFEGMEV